MLRRLKKATKCLPGVESVSDEEKACSQRSSCDLFKERKMPDASTDAAYIRMNIVDILSLFQSPLQRRCVLVELIQGLLYIGVGVCGRRGLTDFIGQGQVPFLQGLYFASYLLLSLPLLRLHFLGKLLNHLVYFSGNTGGI